ncbi:hypothetical protein [Tunturiibacter gelidoferens]|uniref:Uncharacterized protein n=1 Tax=Tunturiibacter lichenicola TaxID=2051959 RepID=A0A7Y9NN00_9BACT|nr:hypothetical protein [Edaphobacter lichenicola]NYF52360.1 hypothetical protein [Edaphobacter lichenicola]
MNALIQAKTLSAEWPSQRLFSQGSPLIQLNNRLRWTEETQQSLQTLSLSVLTDTGVPPGPIQLLASSNADFRELKDKIDTLAPAQVSNTLASIKRASTTIRINVTAAVTSDKITPEAVAAARSSAEQLVSTLKFLPDNGSLDVPRKQAKAILDTLNPQAQAELQALPESLDKYHRIANIAFGFSEVIKANPQIEPDVKVALKQIQSFGEFSQAQAKFVTNFASQSKALSDSLGRDIPAAEQLLPSILNDVSAAQFSSDNKLISEAVERASSFTQQFTTLSNLLKGRSDGSINAASLGLASIGIKQVQLASPQLTNSLAALTTTKGNYASAALGLASSLGINPPPALQSALPLMATAASLFTGVGAVSLISGLAGGSGPLSFVSGFGGGGKDYSADFAAIKQQLAEISGKLDQINSKLDQISDQIRKNQEQLISALEAISFDVQRTQSLLLWEVHAPILNNCGAASNSEVPTKAFKYVTECENLLDLFYAPLGTPLPLTLQANLTTKSLTDNAKEKLSLERNARAFLAKLARDRNCNGLFTASQDIDTLQEKIVASRDQPKVSCDLLLTQQPLIEPGIMATYINLEQSALLTAARFDNALNWWKKYGPDVSKRWNRELTLSNFAVAQQTMMVGDLILPDLAALLEDDKGRKNLQNLWEDQGVATVLAENIVRYWIWNKLHHADGTAQVLYSFAWYSNDARFWKELTGDSPAVFTQETKKVTHLDGSSEDELVWFISYPDLGKVSMPLPSEWMHHELRWTSGLTGIASARDRLAGEMTGMEYISSAKMGTLRDLGQAFAMATPKGPQVMANHLHSVP